jgi:YbbR domain-containing protein
LTGIEVQPAIVTLRGSREALEGIPGYVETLPVKIGGATSDVHAQVGLVLPEGVSIQGDQEVRVTVRVEPVIGSLTIERQVRIQGLREVYTATVALDVVDVIISGPLAILNELDLEDVRVVVDLFELGRGLHKIAPEVFAPEGLTVEAILPETIEVRIELLPGFTAPTATPTRRPTATPTSTPTPTATPRP